MPKIKGLEDINRRINLAKGAIYEWKEEFIKEMTTVLYNKIKERVGLIDIHTQAVLDDMGNPYAKRDPRNPHFPPYTVHRQSGDLFRAVQEPRYKHSKLKSIGEVEVSEQEVYYVRDVLFGNSLMISRDFMGGSLREIEPEVRDTAKKTLKETIAGLKKR